MTTEKVVTKMAFTANERIKFVLDGDLNFSGIKFTDLNEPDDNQEDLDADGLFEASVSLIGLEFAELFPFMIDVFGGIQES